MAMTQNLGQTKMMGFGAAKMSGLNKYLNTQKQWTYYQTMGQWDFR
jgi:hypothetical protein